ncbi:sensor histidine kinase [Ahniella affigens]|uniref:sensor histidine kinase n=1 Tax=Ahniella affigens TaxID=2021234 RepID=UPI001F0C8913|nr:HAMP domain-containing sensor histidine kinase [Ahniella affigens]
MLFGTALTAGFALAVVQLRAYLEDQLIGRQLSLELKNYESQYRHDPNNIATFSRIQGAVFSERKRANVPNNWRDLQNGVHTILDDSQSAFSNAYKLAVRKDDDFWFFLQYDISHEIKLRNRINWALIGFVVLFSGLSALIAFWSASSVMRPVADLADKLTSFRGEAKPQPLKPHFAEDEVGQLAATLDDYAERLTALVERDKEFNADVSHELRTPIAVISGATELLLAQDDLPEKAKQRLRRIERAVRQSNELIEVLLLLSRQEKQAPAHGEETRLVPVVEQVFDTHRVQIGQKPIALKIEAEADVSIAAPPAVLAVALGNLIGNAIKYTPAGDVRVVIRPHQVEVHDEGPGIDPNQAEHLFTRGVRGKDAPGKGGGLGLAIVRRICSLYGWSVSLKPGVEKGAVASLRFS